MCKVDENGENTPFLQDCYRKNHVRNMSGITPCQLIKNDMIFLVILTDVY
jgi:hypothetical protein